MDCGRHSGGQGVIVHAGLQPDRSCRIRQFRIAHRTATGRAAVAWSPMGRPRFPLSVKSPAWCGRPKYCSQNRGTEQMFGVRLGPEDDLADGGCRRDDTGGRIHCALPPPCRAAAPIGTTIPSPGRTSQADAVADVAGNENAADLAHGALFRPQGPHVGGVGGTQTDGGSGRRLRVTAGRGCPRRGAQGTRRAAARRRDIGSTSRRWREPISRSRSSPRPTSSTTHARWPSTCAPRVRPSGLGSMEAARAPCGITARRSRSCERTRMRRWISSRSSRARSMRCATWRRPAVLRFGNDVRNWPHP